MTNKKPTKVSLAEAQRIVLSSQRLVGPTADPLAVIEHLGYVQIDTIAVVERAHHHTLWTRCPNYKPSLLVDLVRKRKVFEYWSHAASFLPMKEYRYTLPMKKNFRQRITSWFPRDARLMKKVLKRVQEEGPLSSRDFDNKRHGKSGWWDWKPSKQALERLFLEGDLEITRRDGFQKVYDLPERVIPSALDTSCPSEEDYIRFLIHRTLRHHGLATADEVAYLKRKDVKAKVRDTLQEMVGDGEIQRVKVPGVDETYFATSGSLENIGNRSKKTMILSPFDNFTIQRKKLKTLFHFDYQIECYLPEKKRKFGYFSLPVFQGHRPLARIDCKADRKGKILWIHSIAYEGNSVQEPKLGNKLKSFARFNGCSELEFSRKF